jgi:chromosomal replication initiator protein
MRFKSILNSAISCLIPNPSAELRREIVTKKMLSFNLPASEDIINFLCTNITSNIRDIESAIRKIKIHTQYVSSSINIDFVRNILEDFLQICKKTISPQDVIDSVCSYFNIVKEDILSESKAKELNLPRQICIGLLKELTSCSYQEISIIFGKKSHTTIMYTISNFDKLKLNPTHFQTISTISSKIKDIYCLTS